MEQTQINELTAKAKRVQENYKLDFPEVVMDRDYLPLKLAEEWGECLQAYLMLTDRGRQKGKSKEEIKELLSQEFADVFAYLLLFAEAEGVDLAESMRKKWFAYLKD